jgi:hypothetical protein
MRPRMFRVLTFHEHMYNCGLSAVCYRGRASRLLPGTTTRLAILCTGEGDVAKRPEGLRSERGIAPSLTAVRAKRGLVDPLAPGDHSAKYRES